MKGLLEQYPELDFVQIKLATHLLHVRNPVDLNSSIVFIPWRIQSKKIQTQVDRDSDRDSSFPEQLHQ